MLNDVTVKTKVMQHPGIKSPVDGITAQWIMPSRWVLKWKLGSESDALTHEDGKCAKLHFDDPRAENNFTL